LDGSAQAIYLLGGRDGIAEAVSEWMRIHHPNVRVAGTHSGYFPARETVEVVRNIRKSEAAILLVAFGAPLQDFWIKEHVGATGVRVAIGVGGLFDFYSGRIPRAAQWLREMGLEWVYRLIQEPGRMWKRYLVGNGVFLSRVLRQRLKAKDISKKK
jgi:N-acetylglucosaminyldiphosphoundecaprenol N-acetyl-beta-D-mannosaminyltransferase